LHAAFTCITLTIIILLPFAALYFSGLLKKPMHPHKAPKTLGIFMNHTRALFFIPENGPQQPAPLESGIENRLRYPGETHPGANVGNLRSTNNEYSRHNREKNQLKQYLISLSEYLEPMDAALILGPKILVNQFKNIINGDKRFAGKQFRFEQQDKMTTAEFHVEVKKFAATLVT
jgi:hypothetical protein